MLRNLFVAMATVSAIGLATLPTAALGADDPVVATVNGISIHRSAVEKAKMGVPQLAQLPLEMVYPMLLDNLINEQLLIEAARKENLQNDPEVKNRLKDIEGRLMAQTYASRAAKKAVNDDMLAKRYEKFKKETPPGEEVRARHILVASEDEAKTVMADLKKGGKFEDLAKSKSIDPGAKQGGDLGFFRKEEMVPEFSEAAFKLKPGQTSETPVKTQFGWHIIKVEERRASQPPKFEEVKEELRAELSQEALSSMIDGLASKAKITRMGLDGKPMEEAPAADKAKPETKKKEKK
jgi:peptidyl-prolyl cis-trans isomerase C